MARMKLCLGILLIVAGLSSCSYFMKSDSPMAEKVAEKPNPQCYWLENVTGKYEWVATGVALGVAYDFEQCYAVDSCDGGLGESLGGCYKWANSAQSERYPWKSNQ